jgi:Ca-activated chloride channel family protein
MTPFTSFVAVEETMITEGGVARRVDVPVELPEGVSYEGVFGGEREEAAVKVKAMTFIPASPGPARQSTPAQGRLANSVLLTDELAAAREARPASKIDPALTGLTGEIRVLVLLSDNSPQVLAQLKKAGLTVIARPQSGKVVMGRISADKLKALAELTPVRYISLAKN